MSRIDEIKARLENYSVEYHSPIIGHQKAEPDMLYLLDRIATMEAVVEAARAWAQSPDMIDWRYNGCKVDCALAALDNDDEKETTHGD